MDQTLKARFEKFIEPCPTTGCWIWLGGVNSKGYGYFYPISKQTRRAHRISWELFRGTLPSDALVLHRCDVPSCVNPQHLFLGTIQDNIRDRDFKGRQRTPTGEKHPMSKLTQAQVDEIRSAGPCYRGLNIKLAEQFGVSDSVISEIRNRKLWSGPGVGK